MSKKARRHPSFPSGSATNYSPGRSTVWATSDPWPDLLPSARTRMVLPQLAPRPNRHRLVAKSSPSRAVTPPKRVKTALQSLFGGWELPPHLLTSQAVQKASICARRHSRRSTLFAKRLTRTGAGAPRKHYSNKGCKP